VLLDHHVYQRLVVVEPIAATKQAREANDLARRANDVAKEANDIARRNNFIAALALFGAGVAIMVSILGLFLRRGMKLAQRLNKQNDA